jgi:hypothetical protein
MTINTERVARDYSQIAGEQVTVEQIKGTLYVFCSELGALRLFHKMPTKGRAAYSENLKTWFFSLDLSMSLAA